MRLSSLLFAAILLATPATAQQPSSSSPETAKPKSEDTQDLEHIREALAKPAPTLTLKVQVPADFKSEVREQQKLDDLMKSFDFRGGPVPAGGLYAYEQQRQVFNSTNRPLMQPYAPFASAELLTLAIESVLEKYIGAPAVKAVAQGNRARAESAARAEVLRSIADYCAAQPAKNDIPICQNAIESR